MGGSVRINSVIQSCSRPRQYLPVPQSDDRVGRTAHPVSSQCIRRETLTIAEADVAVGTKDQTAKFALKDGVDPFVLVEPVSEQRDFVVAVGR